MQKKNTKSKSKFRSKFKGIRAYSIFVFASLLISVFKAPARASEEVLPKEITIGIITGGRPDVVKTQASNFAAALQENLGVNVHVYFPANYNGLVEAMKLDKVQFGFFTAMSYVQAEKQAPVKVLLKKTWNSPFYFSVILTNQKNIKNLHDLKGKKIAFVDENSTSGYLYPMVQFKKSKINLSDFSKIVWSGNHEKSVELLNEGEVSAIAVFADDEKAKEGAWTRFSKKSEVKNKTFRSLWVSDPIPNDPFCVSSSFYESFPKFTHNLMYSMIDLQDRSRAKKEWSEVLGSGPLMPATSRHFDSVREMVKLLDVKPIDK